MKERLGMNAHLPSAVTLDLVPAAGIGSIRADFNWPMIQPERHRWAWDVTDQVVHEARTRHIEVFATLAYTPDWANGGQGRHVPPVEVSDWVAFVRAVALRYRHSVWHWGLWNEPNIAGYWAGSVERTQHRRLLGRKCGSICRSNRHARGGRVTRNRPRESGLWT